MSVFKEIKKNKKYSMQTEKSKREDYWFGRYIRRQISLHFQTQKDDPFLGDKDVIRIVLPIEKFFVRHFYKDATIDDDNICKMLSKIYSYQTKNTDSLVAENKPEELFFTFFTKLYKKFSDISEGTKTISILRILKSIQDCSGGILGNRNYLEMIYSQFNKDGKWSWMFKSAEDELTEE